MSSLLIFIAVKFHKIFYICVNKVFSVMNNNLFVHYFINSIVYGKCFVSLSLDQNEGGGRTHRYDVSKNHMFLRLNSHRPSPFRSLQRKIYSLYSRSDQWFGCNRSFVLLQNQLLFVALPGRGCALPISGVDISFLFLAIEYIDSLMLRLYVRLKNSIFNSLKSCLL